MLKEASRVSSLSGVTTNSEGRAMAQAVSRRPLAAKKQVQSQTSPCGICGVTKWLEQGFFQVLLFSPVSIIPQISQLHSFIYQRRCINLAIGSFVHQITYKINKWYNKILQIIQKGTLVCRQWISTLVMEADKDIEMLLLITIAQGVFYIHFWKLLQLKMLAWTFLYSRLRQWHPSINL